MGRWPRTLRSLWLRQRCTGCSEPNTWSIALRSALEPSITHSRRLVGSRPRSTKSSSRAATNTWFSLAPCRSLSTCLLASRVHADSHEHVMGAELDPVDVDHEQVPGVESALHQLGQRTLGRLDRLTAHRRLAHPDRVGHLADHPAVLRVLTPAIRISSIRSASAPGRFIAAYAGTSTSTPSPSPLRLSRGRSIRTLRSDRYAWPC